MSNISFPYIKLAEDHKGSPSFHPQNSEIGIFKGTNRADKGSPESDVILFPKGLESRQLDWFSTLKDVFPLIIRYGLTFQDCLNFGSVCLSNRSFLSYIPRLYMVLNAEWPSFCETNQIIQKYNISRGIKIVTDCELKTVYQRVEEKDFLFLKSIKKISFGDINEKNVKEITKILESIIENGICLESLAFKNVCVQFRIPEKLKDLKYISCGDITYAVSLQIPRLVNLESFSFECLQENSKVIICSGQPKLELISCQDILPGSNFTILEQPALKFFSCGTIWKNGVLKFSEKLTQLESISLGNIGSEVIIPEGLTGLKFLIGKDIDQGKLIISEKLIGLEVISLKKIKNGDFVVPEGLISLKKLSCGDVAYGSNIIISKDLNCLESITLGSVYGGGVLRIPSLKNLKHIYLEDIWRLIEINNLTVIKSISCGEVKRQGILDISKEPEAFSCTSHVGVIKVEGYVVKKKLKCAILR